ncbi:MULTISPECIES: septum site-determining protein MinC [unclassified Bacillus (in: firmicutes)]|uniref:septum site-determining protein MinC n=1 Tax=unclassified Bacillus (in: firmicutes) TaxID=185979 RepID=UPI0008F34DB5|nr:MULTISPECIES: septum site-determining protein MinC [unclassified Bacillus (in: firmicutes)]SFB16156.1 septum site-determining protein MinC [Bacillus sp. UNCCL13]SFQ78258.1 septum site-determining protein MinC [Bacillus sp. cl95]
MKKRQNVTIKGTKEGLTLHLDDLCSYEELKKELNEKLSASYRENADKPLMPVKVEVGNRYLTSTQQEELKTLIRQKKNLVVDSIESKVMLKSEAEQFKLENEVVTVTKMIRSGQVLEVPGDLLLIGDVNPGGTVMAGGNIFIMGNLKGIAHAGCNGNENAVIAASVMTPSQLRIADCINRSPDREQVEERHDMECAYIDHGGLIAVDRLQALIRLRPELTRLEGGV